MKTSLLVVSSLVAIVACGRAQDPQASVQDSITTDCKSLAGEYAKAEAAYKKLLARKPNDTFAILGLAQTQLMARTEGIDGAKIMQEAIESPDDIEIQLQCADIEIVSGYLEPAFARLLRLIPLFDGAEKKAVKDRLIELFALVDPTDPRVIKARAALANALF
jgi:putative thioredoxin